MSHLRSVDTGDQQACPFNDAGHHDAGHYELFLDNQLCLALYNATNSITRAWTAAIKPFGITYPQLLCLMALWETSPRTVTEISRALDLGKPTVTPLLGRLEEQGLVTRTRDTVDERRVNVGLKPAGQQLQRPVLQARRDLVCAIAITAVEFEALKWQLGTLQDKLDKVA